LPICIAAQEARPETQAPVQQAAEFSPNRPSVAQPVAEAAAQPPAVQTPAPPATPQPASTEQPDPAVAPKQDAPTEQPRIETGTRILGVLPNYKTVDKMTGAYEPITAGAKFMIATKDSFDWPEFFVAAAITELDTLTGQDPEWGQGVRGYAKRYGAALADQVMSNYLTEAILPTVLHDDPRYFRLGPGFSPAHRIVHALSWVIIGKTDTGHNTLNVPELLGSCTTAAIGWYYYPQAERQASQGQLRRGIFGSEGILARHPARPVPQARLGAQRGVVFRCAPAAS
jgi:hypothetical protein